MSHSTDRNQALTQEDKVIAALSHLTILMSFLGLIGTIVIWVTQKDKSEYVGFQALQAMVYQITLLMFWFLGMGCYACSFLSVFLLIPGGAALSDGSEEVVGPIIAIGMTVPFLIFGLMFVGFVVFVIYGIFGAITTLRGREFKYAIIGQRVQQFMEQ